MARIGFIGTGEIASCMVSGLSGKGHDIRISERNKDRAATLAAEFSDVSTHDNQSVLDQSDIVWLTVTADTARSLLPDLNFRPDHRVISAMMGLFHAELQDLCAPATDIAITIPMPFIATGNSPLPVYPASSALEEIFGDTDTVIPLTSETALNAHFAATALSSPLFAQLAATSEWLGELTGNRQDAETYVATLFGGYLSSVPNDGQSRFSEQLQALSTEGGLNATLLAHMKEQGLVTALKSGLDGFRQRLNLPE
ncbi:NAD(P)-binding domain-containing protein [Coralliovum pocilloporae]|uniref:NAD(P)-binding domain-containing protein n=1 Tax=Coralliovum pocilloporae TaxID=3066369 RepID=UPI003306DD5E